MPSLASNLIDSALLSELWNHWVVLQMWLSNQLNLNKSTSYEGLYPSQEHYRITVSNRLGAKRHPSSSKDGIFRKLY
jgi:hypothetical protein